MPEGSFNSTRRVTMTASAAARVRKLRETEGEPSLRLRISVSGGGCSGFQYGFSLDSQRQPDDLVFEAHGAELVVDGVSLDLLAGAEVDFREDLVGSYFAVNNPNAKSSCGCGTSFAV